MTERPAPSPLAPAGRDADPLRVDAAQSEAFAPTDRLLLPMHAHHAPKASKAADGAEVLAGRYTLRRRLGVGGYGSVFLASDAERGHDVALKVLRADLGARPAHLMRFRREFRAVSRLDHPNCLRVFDEGRDGERYFFTMELVEGGDLEGLPPDASDALRLALLIQVTDALDYVHSRRIVHRDLKPANILLRYPPGGGTPTPKLADFGLARPTDGGATVTQTGAVLGTVAFMAPEQLSGHALDPRADLYALGCVLYAVWSGKTPFEHLDNPFQILQAHLESPPPPLTRADGSPVEPGLALLAARLLAKDPINRPQSALEVKRALADLLADAQHDLSTHPDTPGAARVTVSSAGAAPALLSAPAQGQFLYRPPFLGRDDERQRARALIDHARYGSPQAPLLLGLCAPAGMGKSRLLEALCDDLRAGAWRVARVAVAQNPSLAFAPFLDLEAALDALDALAAAPSPARAALAGADHTVDLSEDLTFDQPALSDDMLTALAVPPQPTSGPNPPAPWAPDMVPGEQLDPERARRLRAQALAARLTDPAASPLAVILDDLHDLDPSSEALLYDLIAAIDARCAASPQARWPLLLATLRPGDLRDRLPQRARARARGVAFIDLQPLDRAHIERMLAVMLGLPPEEIKPALVAQVLEDTGGNPLFIQSYLQALVERGLLHRSPRGTWTLSDNLLAISASVELPDAMARVLRDRLHLLSAQTQKLLRVAALIGRRFDSALLQEAAACTQEALLDAIDEGLRAWVIQSTPGPKHLDLYTFDHARLVDVLLADLSPARRRAHHDAIAAALQRRPDTPPSTLARHLSQGAAPHLALPHLSAAAAAAADAYDHQAALALYEQAIALTPDPDPDLLLRCADLLNLLGRPNDARALLEKLLLNPPADPLRRATLQYKLARTLFFSGHTDVAFSTYHQTLRSLGDAAALRRWRLRIALEAARYLLLALVARLLPAPQGAALDALRLRAQCHSDMSVFLYWSNLEQAAAHQLAYTNHTTLLRDPALTIDALGSAMLAQGMFISHRVGQRTFRRAQALSAQHPHLRAKAARLSAFAGIAEAYNDRPDAAEHLLRDALDIAQAQGDRFLIGLVHRVSGWCGTLRNRFSDARHHFERAHDLALELGDLRLLSDAMLGRAGVGLYMGDATQDLLDSTATVLTHAARLNIPAFLALGEETRAGILFFQGDYAQACHHFERAESIYAQHKLFAAWGFLVHIHHAEALLWRYTHPTHAPALLAALRPLRRRARFALRQPVFRGFLPLLSGVIASREGRRAQALKLFDRALAARPPHDPASHHAFHCLILQRVAFERAHLGAPPSSTQPLLTQALSIFERAQTLGIYRWVSSLAPSLQGHPPAH